MLGRHFPADILYRGMMVFQYIYYTLHKYQIGRVHITVIDGHGAANMRFMFCISTSSITKLDFHISSLFFWSDTQDEVASRRHGCQTYSARVRIGVRWWWRRWLQIFICKSNEFVVSEQMRGASRAHRRDPPLRSNHFGSTTSHRALYIFIYIYTVSQYYVIFVYFWCWALSMQHCATQPHVCVFCHV